MLPCLRHVALAIATPISGMFPFIAIHTIAVHCHHHCHCCQQLLSPSTIAIIIDHHHHHWPLLSPLPSTANHHHIHHCQFVVTLFFKIVVACYLCNCFCHHHCSILSSTWLLLLLLLLHCTMPAAVPKLCKGMTKITVQQQMWFHVHCMYNCMCRTLYPTKVHMIPINKFFVPICMTVYIWMICIIQICMMNILQWIPRLP